MALSAENMLFWKKRFDWNKPNSFVEATLVGCVVVLILVFIVKRKKSKNLQTNQIFDVNSLPGPKPFPILGFIGNGLQLLPIKRTLFTISEWAKAYGPLYKTTLAGETFVWLNSPRVLKELLKSAHPGHITKTPVIYDHFKLFISSGVILSKGEEWKSRRKILMRTMSFSSLRGCVPMLNRHSERLAKSIEELFEDGQSHTLKLIINVNLFEVICEMVTGTDVHNTESGIQCHNQLLVVADMMIKRILHPWLMIDWIWKLSPLSKHTEIANKLAQEFAMKLIQNQKKKRALKAKVQMENGEFETLGESGTTDFRSFLDELLDEDLTDMEILEELLVVLIAGHESTAKTLHFLLLNLALNADIQKKCQEEIDAVFASTPDNMLSYEDIANLKYLDCCCQENLRLFPTAFFVARTLEVPLLIDDKQLPIGTNIAISPWCIHRNPEYYPDPEKFDPDRFSPEETAKRPTYAYIPFSGGPRNCLGFKFAQMELKITAAYILRKFTVTTTEKIDEIVILPHILLTAERDFNFVFKKRF